MKSIQIINHSHLDPSWYWLEHLTKIPECRWHHFSSLSQSSMAKIPLMGTYSSRLLAAHNAVKLATMQPNPLVVSHGPRPGYYAARLTQFKKRTDIPHLIFSFNFTSLPSDRHRKAMSQAYSVISRFTVFSTMEKQLYANYFNIDPARIDILHWGVQSADRSKLPAPPVSGRYICAVGSQGRDYAVLAEAAKRLPSVPFHWVIHSENIKGLRLPPNVTVHTSVPYTVAASIVANADLMVLPLKHAKVPCGHVTAVMAMHLGCPIVATDSVGLHDYLQHGKTAHLVEPANSKALTEGILALWEDSTLAKALGQSAQAFAQEHCVEKNTVDYFESFIRNFFQR
jgi:glycosyltransferase involved in cell wall biosynthesis